uniref:Metallophosphoesterase n=1 Tax=candidate division WOR-3 bacterium TaxID=2052148 RepID=A0A7C4GEF2_UNCW3
MRIGIVSDIHANLEALEAVLAVLRGRGADHFANCGDIVGYGPDPGPCIDIVRGLHGWVVAGNHDYAVLGRTSAAGFNSAAGAAIAWTRKQLTANQQLFLRGLPLTSCCTPLVLVHGSPAAPAAWEYVFTLHDAEAQMDCYSESVCVVGHSHYPFAVERTAGRPARLITERSWELRPDAKYFVNAGSVGQPRDGDPRASCLLYDDRVRRMELLRVEYDVAAVQRKIRSAGLPEFLAVRLASGR